MDIADIAQLILFNEQLINSMKEENTMKWHKITNIFPPSQNVKLIFCKLLFTFNGFSLLLACFMLRWFLKFYFSN